MCKLQELVQDGFERFESLDSFEKASFINPRRAHAARVTVLGSVCLSVC